MSTAGEYSTGSRIAAPDEGIGLDELGLAARNHGMPLEALRYDVTPAGLHYLLVHYDIPAIDPATWRLRVDGAVRRPLDLDLAALRARPRRTVRVTLECAGNGRALLRPRPVSQPWLTGAVGTADWTGTPLAPLLADAGLDERAVEVVFTGADHGIERGVEQDYQRALALQPALGEDVLLAYEMNGAPLPVQHGYPVRLIVPGWYGMAHVKWLRAVTVLAERFTGFQNAVAYRFKADADDGGQPVTRIRPRALLVPPGYPDFMSRNRFLPAGEHELVGRAWSGYAPVTGVDVSTDGGATWQAARGRARAGTVGLVAVDVPVVGGAGLPRAARPRPGRGGQRAVGRTTVERPGHGQQHGPAGDGGRQRPVTGQIGRISNRSRTRSRTSGGTPPYTTRSSVAKNRPPTRSRARITSSARALVKPGSVASTAAGTSLTSIRPPSSKSRSRSGRPMPRSAARAGLLMTSARACSRRVCRRTASR